MTSKWTRNDLNECLIIDKWANDPTNSFLINRMKHLDYTDSDLKYDCTKWKNLQLVKDNVWVGVPENIDLPALYTKLLGSSISDNRYKFTTLNRYGIFEWVKFESSVKIQSIELLCGDIKETFDNINAKHIKFAPFKGGLPISIIPFAQTIITVHLSEPGNVEAHAYYTIISNKQHVKILEQSMNIFCNDTKYTISGGNIYSE